MIYNLIDIANKHEIGRKTMLHCPRCNTRMRLYHEYHINGDGSYYPYTGIICNGCGLISRAHYNDEWCPGGSYKLSKAAAKTLLAELTEEVKNNG